MGRHSRSKGREHSHVNPEARRAVLPDEIAKFEALDARIGQLATELGVELVNFRTREARLTAAIDEARRVRDGYVRELAASKGIAPEERERWPFVVDEKAFVKDWSGGKS